VSIEPYVGVRAGLLAAASAPNSLLPADFGVVVVRGDPSRGADVEGVIRSYVPGGTVYDLGAIELVLRSLSRQLGFLWRVCAILSLLVALAVCFSAASIANVRRTAELALFRALGASTRQTYAGPVAEVLTQGLLCGLAGGGLVQVGFLSAIGFVFGVEVPIDAAVLAGSVVVSLVIAVLMQIISVRRSLKLSPLQVLRND
jgi:putative ABC transport system permease protein